MNNVVLEMRNISKSFPGVQALSDVSIDVKRGEIHALVGENGAGKSTLIKILGGVYEANIGTILLENEKIKIKNPTDAIAKGISIIYQEFNLVPTLSVGENIFLGKEICKGKGQLAKINRSEIFKRSKAVMERLNLGEIDVTVPVKDLPVAKQQLVEIGKALENNSKILVMDEPTAVLTEKETKALFNISKELTKNGISIIFISHRLEEVQTLCDRITILRDGKFITTLDNKNRNVEKDEIVRYMVGRNLTDYYPKGEAAVQKDTMMRVNRLTKKGMFENVSFELKRGEILGFSGLIGAGRTELAMTLFGAVTKDSGEIEIDGKPLIGGNIPKAISSGITLVPEDRKGGGLVLMMSLSDNIAMPNSRQIARFGVVNFKKKLALTRRFIKDMSIRPDMPERKTLDLSGGNQQKVVIAKWLATNPKVLILDEPTRGVDVGAKAEIYALMRKLTAQGMSIMFISSEMPELLGMCDRILVMHEGRISGEFNKNSMNQQSLMRAAMGLQIVNKEA